MKRPAILLSLLIAPEAICFTCSMSCLACNTAWCAGMSNVRCYHKDKIKGTG